MNAPESASESARFYENLGSFTDFVEITEDRHFRLVPDDWCVVITDVKGSTQAIEAGRYKDVNTIGAASIVVVQNAMRNMEFPFVFGGDGATLLIPRSCRDLVSAKLAALKSLSVEKFGLELRVGIVDVSEIVEGKASIEVAKFELVPGSCVAVFRGGGLTLAEKLVKGVPGKYEIPARDSDGIDLGGLSCRWHDIPNKRGCILSMLVTARESSADPKQVYLDLLDHMRAIIASPLQDANPVNLSSMSFRSAGENSAHESRFQKRFSMAWIRRCFEIVVSSLAFKLGVMPRSFAFERYANSIRDHSDYRKFDDMLRMIIDCSPEQVEALRQYLEEARQRGELHYGLHESETSLMTCYVHSLHDGDHIHFIDGGNGGYAMAAKQLKAQMKEG